MLVIYLNTSLLVSSLEVFRKTHDLFISFGVYQDRYSGPTIHFVDEHYDTGRILAQRVVPVLPTDTADELAARVLQEVLKSSPP